MRFKKVLSNLEPEGQGPGIIIGVTRLVLPVPFYTIQTIFMYFLHTTLFCPLSWDAFCNAQKAQKPLQTRQHTVNNYSPL